MPPSISAAPHSIVPHHAVPCHASCTAQHRATPRRATPRHASAGATPRCPQESSAPKQNQRLGRKVLADTKVRMKLFEGFSAKMYCSATKVC